MAEELTTKQFVDIETGKPISNPVYIGDVYDKDGADAVLRLFGQDKTRDTCGRVGDYRITDDPVLAENHLWPDGGPIDPVAWPELHAYAARLGWQTDAAGRFLLPDLRGKYLVGADSRDPDFAAGKESGEKAHTLTKAELPNVSIGLGAAVIKSDTEAIRVTDSGPLWYRMGRSVQETAGPLGNGEPHNNLPPYRAVYIQLRAKPDPVVAQEVAADRLATARRIGSASFDGSADITLAQMGVITQSNMTLHVSPTGNDNTGKGTQGAPYKTIARAIQDVPQIVNHTITISLAPGNYGSETISLGMSGKGALQIVGSGNSLANATNYKFGYLRFFNFACSLNIYGISTTSSPDWGGSLQFENCSHVFVQYCDCQAGKDNGKAGVYMDKGYCYVHTCNFHGCSSAVFAVRGGVMAVTNSTGNNNTTGFNASMGGVAVKMVDQTNNLGGTNATSAYNGGIIVGPGGGIIGNI